MHSAPGKDATSSRNTTQPAYTRPNNGPRPDSSTPASMTLSSMHDERTWRTALIVCGAFLVAFVAFESVPIPEQSIATTAMMWTFHLSFFIIPENRHSASHATIFCYAPQTKILEGETREEMLIFEALFTGESTQFGPLTMEKCFENSHCTPPNFESQTKILEVRTNLSECVFEALFKGVSTRFGLRIVENCFEHTFGKVGSDFQNLRLGSMHFISCSSFQNLRLGGA
jgi:hypothetical protein